MLTIACKATFDLRPGECPLASAQEPVHAADRYWRDDPAGSVQMPSDLVPPRVRADVTLVGHAYAPRGERVRVLDARLCVGDVDKRIEVHADRVFKQTGLLEAGTPFSKMSLRWECAAGGLDTWNPVGRPPREGSVRGERILPNLQRPGVLFTGPDDPIEPVGFGPIAPGWPDRVRKLGRRAGSWAVNEWHRQPLPADFDVNFFNVAPPDQQVAGLLDEQRIRLEHLHPEYTHLDTRLPGLRPRAYVERPDETPQVVPLIPDALWIDTDRGICTLTWRGQVSLYGPEEAGSVFVALERRGETVSWADVQRLAAGAGPTWRGASSEHIGAPASRPTPPRSAPGDTLTGDLVPSKPALPFQAGEPPSSQRPHGSLGAPGPLGAPLPLGAAPLGAIPLGASPRLGLGAGRPPAPTPSISAPVTSTPAVEPPAPPPMIGPLASWEQSSSPPSETEATAPASDPGSSTESESSASLGAPELAQPVEVSLSVEQCASIAARLDHRPAERDTILEVEGVALATWESMHARRLAEIQEELRRGKKLVLSAYDKAYVAALEAKRGPISAHDYARLVIAAERGTLEESLAALDLPEGAMMRLRRVWLARTVADPRVAAEVRGALQKASED
ncbi:uncharacterized protein CMC5_054660 [Chondromyces crocatus]|uniref:DUF2169 domain-containing protein n=1 Tax=Chondromyces crocatus TaxID=52 RepID=A0A0K1EKZ8_CHOCO|nr:uncharacterized protein CMC5_054660 [Chondromyces crocatus]